VLRALDYFQGVGDLELGERGEGIGEEWGSPQVNVQRDERFREAIELVRNKRKPDGRWVMAQGMQGRIFFELEKAGEPSRWNTLRALRVLKWWEGVR